MKNSVSLALSSSVPEKGGKLPTDEASVPDLLTAEVSGFSQTFICLTRWKERKVPSPDSLKMVNGTRPSYSTSLKL